MKFEPKSEKEIQSMNLMEHGIYDFEVLAASDKISKSGNEMIELKLKVWDKNGSERLIFDYLLESMAYKLRHFCVSVDLSSKYESGELTAHDCVGKSGQVEIIIQKSKDPNYSDKNAVKDYIVELDKKSSVTKPLNNDSNFLDDVIPF